MSAQEQPIVETPVAVPETPAAPPAVATVIPANEDRAETIKRIANTPPSERGKHANLQPREQGRFAGPPSAAPPTPPAPVVPPAPPAPVRPDMPKSLKLELKQHWEAAHPELAAAIHQRELDYEKGVTPLKEKARIADELLGAFQPYEDLIRAQNATPKQVISNLMQTARILHTGSPVQKAQAVAQTMRQFGISPEHVQQVLSGNAPPQPALDPQFGQLYQQLQTTQQQVAQLTTQQQQAAEARAVAAIQKFAGDTANKHFDAVSPQMMLLLQNPQALGEGVEAMSEDEKLRLAYDHAIWANPEIRKQVVAEQQAKDLAEQQEKQRQQVAQAKQAAVQVRGAPSAGPPPQADPKDRLAFIRNAVKGATR